jgi:hypothetical protein
LKEWHREGKQIDKIRPRNQANIKQAQVIIGKIRNAQIRGEFRMVEIQGLAFAADAVDNITSKSSKSMVKSHHGLTALMAAQSHNECLSILMKQWF